MKKGDINLSPFFNNGHIGQSDSGNRVIGAGTGIRSNTAMVIFQAEPSADQS